MWKIWNSTLTLIKNFVKTISGEKAQNRKALEMILTKVQEDPLSASCLNISYGDVQGLVANPNPTGSPFASMNPNAVGTNGVIDQRSPNKVPNSTILPNTPFSLNLGNGRSLDLRFNSVPGWPTADPSLMNQFLQQMTSTLRALGFTENTIEEIIRYSFLTLDNPSQCDNYGNLLSFFFGKSCFHEIFAKNGRH